MKKIKIIKTKIIKPDKLREAAEIIKNGGLVVFPTETVYGLGANALDFNAVKKIYEVKGRPPDNPLIVHFADPADIYKYAEVPEVAGKIIEKFMPAPLTLVLKKKSAELDAASPGLDTVAVRAPENSAARELIKLAGVPVAAPSANLSGKPSPTNAGHIIKDLDGKVDMIICGGNCEIGLESTVLAFGPDGGVNILRSGYITKEMLAEFKISDNSPENPGPPQSPGIKYAHYAPDAPLYILSGGDESIIDFIKKETRINNNAGFLCFDEMSECFENNKNIISIGPRNDLKEQARNLFGALNRFNNLGVDIIYSIEPARTDIGEAIYNRLIKAAGGKIIKL